AAGPLALGSAHRNDIFRRAGVEQRVGVDDTVAARAQAVRPKDAIPALVARREEDGHVLMVPDELVGALRTIGIAAVLPWAWLRRAGIAPAIGVQARPIGICLSEQLVVVGVQADDVAA